MTPRSLAVVMALACLVLLGATAADWSVVEADRTIDTDEADVVVEQTEATGGAEVAGGLLVVGLVGLVVAGLTARWPIMGSTQLPLGVMAAVESVDAIRSLEGATPAPALALVAGAVLFACGTEAVRVGVVGPDARRAARVEQPSRYTVEAVRGETADPDDEWDIAVADDTGQDEGRG